MRNFLPQMEIGYKEFDLINYINKSDKVRNIRSEKLSNEVVQSIKDIKIGLDPIFSNKSFSNRCDTLKLLREFGKEKDTNIIGIDGSEFSTKIKKLDANQAIGTILEKAGIDGVIFEGIKDTTNKVGILLGVADCAGIVGTTKDGNNIFNIHGGYKGILGKKDGGIGIIAQLIEEIRKDNYKQEDLILNISPMAGSDFELGRDFIEEMFNEFKETQLSESKSFKFDFNNYFENTYILNGEQKGEFNLRKLILDIFDIYGIKNYSFTNIDTNSNNNLFSSYRLYTQSKNKNNNNFGAQVIDSRMGVYISN